MTADLENTTRQIIARLDDYLPEFNTSLMDGRLQDVILKHPIVRSLLVPPADQAARRRCVNLISRAVAAATPVLPLILQDQDEQNPDQLLNGARKSILIGTGSTSKKPLKTHFRLKKVPHLTPDTQKRLLNYISELSKKESLTEFWMTHHTDYQQMKANKKDIGSKRPAACSLAEMYKTESTLGLYLRLKIFRDILVDIGDRVQGTVCKVFWEYWDEIYIYLAGVVGDKELEHTDDGRLFRMSGDAALYVDSQTSMKKRKLAEQQRLSIIAEEENYESSAEASLPAMVLMSPVYSSMKDDIFGSQSDVSMKNHVSPNEMHMSVSPNSSATPESLAAEDSFDEASVTSPGSHKISLVDTTHSNEVHGLSLIDASELNFMMKSGASHTEHKNMPAGNNRGSTSSDSREEAVLDLRARIKMMEEDDSQSGYSESMLSASSQIVW